MASEVPRTPRAITLFSHVSSSSLLSNLFDDMVSSWGCNASTAPLQAATWSKQENRMFCFAKPASQRTRQNQNLLPTYRQNLVLPGSAGARRRRAPAEPNVA